MLALVEVRQEIVVGRALDAAHDQQPQRARDLVAFLRGGGLDARHGAVHVAGDGVDLFAQAGQAEFAVAAMQQHAADRVLEPLERLADRRLA